MYSNIIAKENCCFANWSLYMQGKVSLKKEADYSRLVSGKFNMQGNLHEAYLRQLQDDLCACPPNLRVYAEALTGFGHLNHPMVSTPHDYLTAVSWGQLSGVRKAGRSYIPRTGKKVRGL